METLFWMLWIFRNIKSRDISTFFFIYSSNLSISLQVYDIISLLYVMTLFRSVSWQSAYRAFCGVIVLTFILSHMSWIVLSTAICADLFEFLNFATPHLVLTTIWIWWAETRSSSLTSALAPLQMNSWTRSSNKLKH